jgi:hypothetical protein
MYFSKMTLKYYFIFIFLKIINIYSYDTTFQKLEIFIFRIKMIHIAIYELYLFCELNQHISLILLLLY